MKPQTSPLKKPLALLPSSSIIAAVIVLLLFVSGISFSYWTADTVTFTVTDKERVVTGSSKSPNSKYLVFTESETFENTDCFTRFKFTSSDLQGQLHVGQTYEAKVYGWRIPFLSKHRNIVSIEPSH